MKDKFIFNCTQCEKCGRFTFSKKDKKCLTEACSSNEKKEVKDD